MNLKRFGLKGGPQGWNLKPTLNGRPLPGVTGVDIRAGMDGVTSVHLDMIGELDVDLLADVSATIRPLDALTTRIELGPDDVLVLHAKSELTADEMTQIRKAFERGFDRRVLVLDSRTHPLYTIKAADVPANEHPADCRFSSEHP